LLLLVCRIKPIFVGSFLLHTLHGSTYDVKSQVLAEGFSSPATEKERLFPPPRERRGSPQAEVLCTKLAKDRPGLVLSTDNRKG
jgi:hypothetical protein